MAGSTAKEFFGDSAQRSAEKLQAVNPKTGKVVQTKTINVGRRSKK